MWLNTHYTDCRFLRCEEALGREPEIRQKRMCVKAKAKLRPFKNFA